MYIYNYIYTDTYTIIHIQVYIHIHIWPVMACTSHEVCVRFQFSGIHFRLRLNRNCDFWDTHSISCLFLFVVFHVHAGDHGQVTRSRSLSRSRSRSSSRMQSHSWGLMFILMLSFKHSVNHPVSHSVHHSINHWIDLSFKHSARSHKKPLRYLQCSKCGEQAQMS